MITRIQDLLRGRNLRKQRKAFLKTVTDAELILIQQHREWYAKQDAAFERARAGCGACSTPCSEPEA